MKSPIRIAVIGAGAFGRNHARVLSKMPGIDLRAIVDSDRLRAQQLANEYGSTAFAEITPVMGDIDAAVVATPTITHYDLTVALLKAGIDVLVEKPIAETSLLGERLAHLAEDCGRILQVGHLERFNPAVAAVEKALTIPLFFEVHRLSIFTPRSLDIDVVLDLMIHDLEVVLGFTGEIPNEVRAAGISVLSPKVDIANVRLAFPSGCIANLTASRVSIEQVRKLRLFQPGEYLSLDYKRQDATRLGIQNGSIGFNPLAVERGEPLQLELEAFLSAVHDRSVPKVDGFAAARALLVAESILAKIKEHADLVTSTLRRKQ